MSFVEFLKRNFAEGYTKGYTGLEISDVELERDTKAQRPIVLVRVYFKVHSWDGRRLRVHVLLRDAKTREQLAWTNGTTLSDEPLVFDSGYVTLRVSLTTATACYAQVTLFDGANPIADRTSAVLEIPASSANTTSSADRGSTALATTPPPPASPDHELLGLRAGCSLRELKAAYKRAIAEWHPDRFAHSSDALRTVAAEQTRSIIAAYERLSKRSAA